MRSVGKDERRKKKTSRVLLKRDKVQVLGKYYLNQKQKNNKEREIQRRIVFDYSTKIDVVVVLLSDQ